MDSSIHCRKAAALFDVAHMCGASFRVGQHTECWQCLPSACCMLQHDCYTRFLRSKWLPTAGLHFLIFAGKGCNSIPGDFDSW